MKNAYYAIIGLAILIVGQVLAQTTEPETQGPLTIKWCSATLPNSTGSESWSSASSNWMDVIRTNVASKGVDNQKAENISFCDYPGMVTSSVATYKSWRGQTTESVEYGNRQYFGFKVFCNDSGAFIPANITCLIKRQGWNYGNKVWFDIYQPVVVLMNYDNTTFRQRLDFGINQIYGDSDDVVGSDQKMSTSTKAFMFGGYGVSLAPFGNGDNQAKLTNTLTYLQSNKFRLVMEVVVPHSNGTNYTFNSIFMPPILDISNLKVTYSPRIGQTNASLQWFGGENKVYQVEKSSDLIGWIADNYTSSNGDVLYPVQEEGLGNSKYFYRLRAW